MATKKGQKQEAPAKEPGMALDAPKGRSLAQLGYSAEDLGAGFEDFTQADLAIPFINILQKMSPAVDPDAAGFIEGAKAGMLVNSVTQELFDGKEGGVVVIPVHRVHQFIEWRPRDEGGGFIAAHEVDSPMIIEAKKGGNFGELQSPEGNDLVETFNVYAIMVTADGDPIPVILPFSSTNIKSYKKWMTTARSVVLKDDDGRRFPAPMFAHQYRLLTQLQENAKGTWYTFKVSFANGDAESSRMAADDELYEAARNFRDLVLSGAAKPAYQSTSQDEEEDGGEEDGKAF